MVKSRRAVGGLISLIGIIIVVGIVATALITLVNSQEELFRTQNQINEIQRKQIIEQISFGDIDCSWSDLPNGIGTVTIPVTNDGPRQIFLNSILITVDNDLGYSAMAIGQSKIPGEPTFNVTSLKTEELVVRYSG